METALKKQLRGGTFGKVPRQHSQRMRKIRDKGSRTTELRFRAMLVRAGIRGWQMHPDGFAGKPDFIFRDLALVVFVDGCYWHGCRKCHHAIRVNAEYWEAKIKRNRERDKRNAKLLVEQGYDLVRFWEHDLQCQPEKCLQRLGVALEMARKVKGKIRT